MIRLFPSEADYNPQRKTVTVAQLIEHLQKFKQDLPAAFTWEGQVLPVVLELVTKEYIDCYTNRVQKPNNRSGGRPFVQLNAET